MVAVKNAADCLGNLSLEADDFAYYAHATELLKHAMTLSRMHSSASKLHFPDEFLDLNNEARDKAFNKLVEQKRFIWFSPQEALKPEKKAKYNELKVQLKPYKNIEAVESPIEEFKSILLLYFRTS